MAHQDLIYHRNGGQHKICPPPKNITKTDHKIVEILRFGRASPNLIMRHGARRRAKGYGFPNDLSPS